MDQPDILYKMDAGIFSFRVAGILIRGSNVLLQRASDDLAYAFPGGHVNFGETSENAVVREFKEETTADIIPLRLLWVGENFFPWGGRDCHQICFYYLVALRDETQLPSDRSFLGMDEIDQKRIPLEFSWVDISTLDSIPLYPMHASEKLMNLSEHIEWFVFIENPTKGS